jgi:HAD superfamily hydrolase (TIGR01509 family)
MIQAILFDMDGLLIDSGPVWKAAYSEVLSLYGLDFSDAHYVETAGMRLEEATKYWAEKGLYTSEIQPKVQKQIHEFVMQAIATCPYMPGAESFLEQVQALGLPIALVSASEREIVDYVVELRGWSHIFETTVSGDDVTCPKPNPEAYLHTAKILGVDNANCMIFEDSVPGILAAVRSGGYTVAVPKKGTEKQDVLDQANEVYSSLIEVTLDHVKDIIIQ